METLEIYVIPWILRLLLALLILVAGRWLARGLTALLRRSMQRYQVDAALVNFLGNASYVVLLVAVALAAAGTFGIDTTPLLAVLGAAGLAVALAMKDSLSNLAAGVMIVVLRPFRIGDFISAGGSSGSVQDIGLFCTILHTPDNQRIIMPNAAIFGGTIVNATALPTRRIDLKIGIGYQDEVERARQVIMDLVAADSRVLKQPAPTVEVVDLASSSVNLLICPWVNSADYWKTRVELLERIKAELARAGITIPYPQQDVHLHQVQAQ